MISGKTIEKLKMDTRAAQETQGSSDLRNQTVVCTLSVENYKNILGIPIDGFPTDEVICIQQTRWRNGLNHGDTVRVLITQQDTREKKLKGEVKEVVSSTFPQMQSQAVLCRPDESSLKYMLPLDPKYPRVRVMTQAKFGRPDRCQKIIMKNSLGQTERAIINCLSKDHLYVVQYLEWTEKHWFPVGQVTAILRAETNLTILDLKYGLSQWSELCRTTMQFPSAQRQICAPETSRLKNINRTRKDLTNLFCFTIDDENAQDLDDAFSVEEIRKVPRVFKVGVHIADVSAVVMKDTETDVQAFRQGESFYSYQGYNTSMLPRDLSQNSLSLLPDENRRVISIFFYITKTKEGTFKNENDTIIQRSWIQSKKQLSYAEANRLIRDQSNDHQLALKLQQLNYFALELRKQRVGDIWRALPCDQKRNINSHRTVEEWMIQTNHEIATKIFHQLQTDALNLSPLLHQAAPITDESAAFVQDQTRMETFGNDFRFLQSTWAKLMQWAHGSVIDEDVENLLAMEDLHPTTAPGRNKSKINPRSEYTTPQFLTEQGTTDFGHYQLLLAHYTHFTSPIRRYFDIPVHRMLLATIDDGEIPYNANELRQICIHCNEMRHRAKSYRQESYSVLTADRAHVSSSVKSVCAIVSEIGEDRMFLEIPELENTCKSLSSLKYNWFQLFNIELPTSGNGYMVKMKWKCQFYSLTGPEISGPKLKYKDERNEGLGYKKQQGDSSCLEIPTDQNAITIPIEYWRQIKDSIREHDEDKLERTLLEAEKIAKSSKNPLATYKQSNKSGSVKKNEFFFEMKWKSSSTTKLQLSKKKVNNINTPVIQLVYLAPEIQLCTEHNSDPETCFSMQLEDCTWTKDRNYKYHSLLEYQTVWMQLLQLEEAQRIASWSDRSSFFIDQVPVTFKVDFNNVQAKFKLGYMYCHPRMIKFATNKDYRTIPAEMKRYFTLDRFCMRVPIEVASEAWNADDETHITEQYWVGHFAAKKIELKDPDEDSEKFYDIQCKLLYASEECQLPDRCPQLTLMEIFPLSEPTRRMQKALLRLRDDGFPWKIARGNYRQRCQGLHSATSVVWHHAEDHRNTEQNQAIRKSLEQPFSLIWGPPGTGKTLTATELAIAFAIKQNMLQNDVLCPPKVVYCAPSNKAVDVAAKLMMKNKELEEQGIKLIRMYSRQLERSVYPVPFEDLSGDQRPDPDFNCISLHNLIRQHHNPSSAKIKQYDDMFKKIMDCIDDDEPFNHITNDLLAEVEAYQEIVMEAELRELSQSHIIMSTCCSAEETRLHLRNRTTWEQNYKINQVILDEASMSNELESLIPLVMTGCRSLVLVGDHRQLQPIVLSKKARRLGFDCTLFTKYVDNPRLVTMLTTHYRMHVGIAEFPSKHFYKGQLKPGTSKQKQSSDVSLWPDRDHPAVFCHCIGKEESRVIQLQDASELSQFNQLEATHVVRILGSLTQDWKLGGPGKIAVLTPYRAQITCIKDKIKEMFGPNDEILRNTAIMTVVKSQGEEWEYVIVSTVRSRPVEELEDESENVWKILGFVADPHQLCVAITRAIKGLIIVGNPHSLMKSPHWKALVYHYRDKRCLVNAEDFLV